MSDLIVGPRRLIRQLGSRRFDGVLEAGLDDLRGDGAIDPDTTDADAQPAADVTVVAAAMIAVGMARSACSNTATSSGYYGGGSST